MIYKHLITKDQALDAIKNGDFGAGIISSKENVIIILTQDWCPQWVNMKNWIYKMDVDMDINIFELEYNKESYFHSFMGFKESVYRNFDVPYLRFYRNGELFQTSNYINKSKVIDILKS